MTRPKNNVARLAADAAALVRIASPADWPGGFAVVADRLPGRTCGVAVGAGRGLATLYKLRPGVHAVVVDPWKFCRDPDTPTTAEVVILEATTLHEAAHALTSGETTPESVDELLSGAGDAIPAYSPAKIARHHNPRWAAALWILAGRASGFRPRLRAALLAYVAADVARYGYAADELARVVVGVEADAPLRAKLAVGGAWDTLLCARLPDEQTRANAIVAAGVEHGSAEG